MKHPTHQLQAYLDGALSATDQSAISGHLAVCQICRQEFESLQANAQVIQATLDRLDPSVAEVPDPAHAFQAFQTRAAESAPSDLRPLWLRSLQMKFRPAFRPAGMGLAILALLAVLIGVVPVREAAANFLRLFRVQQITVISLDMAQSQRMQEIFEVLDAGLLGEPQVLRQPGEPLAYNNLTQASEAAGFRLLQPADLPERLQLAETTVVQGPHMRMTVERQALETLAAALQVDVGELSELDGTSVEVNVPVVVEQRYLAGEAQDGTLIFVQAPSPEVLISPDVDPAILGEIFLRLLGMSALEAREMAAKIDWTATLIVPLPADMGRFREIEIGAAEGVLIEPLDMEGRDPETVILWQENGFLYGLHGRNIRSAELIEAARSLR